MFLVINKTFLFLILFLLGSSSAFSQVGIAFGSGQGIRHIIPYRLAVSWDFGSIWRLQSHWALNALWETSGAVWDGPRRPDLAPDRVTDLNAFTTGPMFRWQYKSGVPYLELGVGLSWLSKTEMQGRILSLHFQFEDKIGLGLRFGNKQQYDIALRAYHYSNASIKRPNSGVNLAMVNVGFWIPC